LHEVQAVDSKLVRTNTAKGGEGILCAGTSDFLCRTSHIVDTEEQLHNPSA